MAVLTFGVFFHRAAPGRGSNGSRNKKARAMSIVLARLLATRCRSWYVLARSDGQREQPEESGVCLDPTGAAGVRHRRDAQPQAIRAPAKHHRGLTSTHLGGDTEVRRR